jgi:lysophospholipase L1-like esterase
MTTRRRIGFAALTVLLLLGAAELTLQRLAPEGTGREQGFVGHSTVVPYLKQDGEHWVPNRSEMSRYTRLPVARALGGLRVAVLGGSTIASPPPDGPSWQLAAMLKLGFSGPVDVLNAGGHGFGSTRVRGAMADVLEHDLDMVVLYAGHNEFTESRYVPSLSLQGGPGGLLERLRRGSRIYEALRLGIQDMQEGPHEVSMAVPGGSLASGELARLEQRFADNLKAMAEDMKAHGVRGVWVLPASNLAVPPEASERRGAAAAFARGEALRKSGDRASALATLREARDLDQVPRRATSGWVKIMADVANQYGIALVDAEAVLYKHDPDRTLRGEYSSDRMHLDAVGYRLVMAEVYWAMSQLIRLKSYHSFRHQMPAPGASLAPVLGPIERTVAAPTLSELEHKPRSKVLSGGR